MLAGACTLTAQDALQSCRREAAEEYFIHTGNCRNIAAGPERAACWDEAMEARSEAREVECQDVHRARLEVCALVGEQRYDPLLDPADFLDPADIPANPNPYFPLVPGNEWVYQNPDETITVTVLSGTRIVSGIKVVIVRDVVRDADGRLVEHTNDWYAQHVNGDIWYMGELARNYERGRLHNLDGSWEAGREFAKPGILVRAQPEVGQVIRQEMLLGEAEDIAEVISLTGTEAAVGSSCENNCLVNRESTPLEPDVSELKYYAPGIGLIVELDPVSGDRLELTSFTPGG